MVYSIESPQTGENWLLPCQPQTDTGNFQHVLIHHKWLNTPPPPKKEMGVPYCKSDWWQTWMGTFRITQRSGGSSLSQWSSCHTWRRYPSCMHSLETEPKANLLYIIYLCDHSHALKHAPFNTLWWDGHHIIWNVQFTCHSKVQAHKTNNNNNGHLACLAA